MGNGHVGRIFIFLLCFYNLANCAKILGVFPSPGYSQYILAESLIVALAERGHTVTVISAFQTKDVKNLRNIVIDRRKIEQETLSQLRDLNIFENIAFLHELCLNFSEDLLSTPSVQELVNSDETFDLVIVETFLSEALQAFAKHFNAHQVLFSSIAVSEWNSYLIGIPNIPSYVPVTFSGYTTSMRFYERFRNALALWYCSYYKELHALPAHQKLVNKYFPNKYILEDFIYNASLMLTCSHVSTSETVPLTTSVVEIGGLHIKTNKLPENIQRFLDSAENGAIFFSMGTNLQSSSMPKEILKAIITMFGNLNQKVLWKFEMEDLENKPSNLMISKWFPQSDILAHPNTVAFISHCGMGSTMEAVYHGVPVIGIPIYGDQSMNLHKIVQFGMGIELPFKQLSAETLNNSIQNILSNKEYMKAAKRRSKISKDRPVKPLDEAIYWVEYVLRHDGARHLRSSIFNLPWYQLYLVDILFVLFSSLILLTCVIYSLLRCVKGSFRHSKVKTH